MKTINGSIFYGMLISAANGLDNKKEIINNMNVFPVPDGDTGINMTLTLRTVKGLSDYDGTLSDCAKHAAEVVLRAARGNSGAILSLFFRGMSKAFRGLDVAGPEDIAHAFRIGHEEAYRAVCDAADALSSRVLLHGDYCLPNILLDRWRFSAFIDLGAAGVGDRHIDLFWGAWTLAYNLGTNAYRDTFLSAYGREAINTELLDIIGYAECFG